MPYQHLFLILLLPSLLRFLQGHAANCWRSGLRYFVCGCAPCLLAVGAGHLSYAAGPVQVRCIPLYMCGPMRSVHVAAEGSAWRQTETLLYPMLDSALLPHFPNPIPNPYSCPVPTE
jgi:hypothetical protein